MDAIILAAGRGSRMNSELPKCANEVLGKPIINYIIDCLNKTIIKNIIVVVGYKKEIMIDTIDDKKIYYAYQKEQLGTANAVLCCKEVLDKLNSSSVLIIPGDTIIDLKTVVNFINDFAKKKLKFSILTMNVLNPTSFGRIIKNEKNEVVKIIEEKDIKDNFIKNINEINTGIYLIEKELLFENLVKIKNNNQAKEYYFTDLIEIIKDVNINSFLINYNKKLLGVNDIESLKELEIELMLDYKFEYSGLNIKVSEDSIIDKNVVILDNTLIKGKSYIGKNSIIGPNVIIESSFINENTKINNKVVINTLI